MHVELSKDKNISNFKKLLLLMDKNSKETQKNLTFCKSYKHLFKYATMRSKTIGYTNKE